MSKEEILKKINEVEWFHRFEVLPGIITPGKVGTNARKILDIYSLPKTLKGLNALDIGTWDGPYAFELENRGAKVTALDIQDPDCTGFNIAKELRQSSVEYVRASVDDLKRVLKKKYDIICFFGVYYHLKCPIFAFEQIQSVLKDDGILLIEGECLRNYAEELSGKIYCYKKSVFENFIKKIKRRTPKLAEIIQKLFFRKPHNIIATMADSNIPITLCYPGNFKDAHNWFIPNLACIRSWIMAAGLEIKWYHFSYDTYPKQRIRVIATKAKDSEVVIEHRLVEKDKTRFW